MFSHYNNSWVDYRPKVKKNKNYLHGLNVTKHKYFLFLYDLYLQICSRFLGFFFEI